MSDGVLASLLFGALYRPFPFSCLAAASSTYLPVNLAGSSWPNFHFSGLDRRLANFVAQFDYNLSAFDSAINL